MTNMKQGESLATAVATGKSGMTVVDDFNVGCWQVKPMLNRIQSTGTALQSTRSLEPRLMQLLCYLKANEGEVSTREELVSTLWPRVIVNENSLTRAVSELRKQLTSDYLPGSSYIETIPKKGYRLSPAVLGDSDTTALLPASINNATAGVLKQPQYWSQLASAASLALVVGLWAWQLNPASQEPSDVFLADEVISHDSDWYGGKLTLSSLVNGEFNGVNEDLGLSIHHSSPVLSNDKTSLAFLQLSNSGSTIFVAKTSEALNIWNNSDRAQLTPGMVDTSALVVAAETPAVAVYNSSEKLTNLSWSPVGNALLFAKQTDDMANAALYTRSQPAKEQELLMLDLETLETSRLVKQDEEAARRSKEGSDVTTLT